MTEEKLEQAISNVGEDAQLTPAEKETTIRFAKDQDRARIATAESGLMRRVLAHPESAVVSIDTLDGNVRERGKDIDDYSGGDVVGVVATIPVGALQVKLSSRQSSQHAKIVTDRVLGEVKP